MPPSEATIVCTCANCEDEHPLGDRLPDESTAASAVCPVCGSPEYRSDYTGEEIRKSEAQRIYDAVKPVRNIGQETAQNLVDTFGVYSSLERASIAELETVDGVGTGTAANIQERLNGQ